MRFSYSSLRFEYAVEDCALVALDLLAVGCPSHHHRRRPWPQR